MTANKYKDTDLREALKRKYANSPQLPSDFKEKMELRMEAAPKRRPLWRWIAAAACLVAIIGISITVMPIYQATGSKALTAQKVEHQSNAEQSSADNKPGINKQPADTFKEQTNISASKKQIEINERTSVIATKQESYSVSISNPNIHYAALTATVDSVPYQDPARVDDFIAELASYYKVKAVPLRCTSDTGDSIAVSTAYVFKDEQELDLFARLLQVACWYNSKTPGYLLNFSQEQFFFKLEDSRKNEKCLWMAERIGKEYVLLFSTHFPKNVTLSSACFQEYREQLTHISLQTLNL